MSNYKSVLMGELSARGVYYEGEDSVKDLERSFREHNLKLPAKPEEKEGKVVGGDLTVTNGAEAGAQTVVTVEGEVQATGGETQIVQEKTIEELKAQCDAKGIKYHPRTGEKKLKELLK